MSNHIELFGCIICHLTPAGQKPAKAQMHCEGEERSEKGLFPEIEAEGSVNGTTYTLLWWEPEARPAEGTMVRVQGEWKDFREDVELHVFSTEVSNKGIFKDVFSYCTQIQSILARTGVRITQGALCGFSSHPEPLVPLCVSEQEILPIDRPLHLGWPIVMGIPIFSLPISLKKEGEKWMASQRGSLRIHEETLVLLGMEEQKAMSLSMRFSTLGYTGVEQLAHVRHMLGDTLNQEYLNPEILDGYCEKGIENSGLLFSLQYSHKQSLQALKTHSDETITNSLLGVYFGERSSKSYKIQKSFPMILPLNWEQFLCVSSSLSKELTVVTGPPGTGKSQVLLAATAAALLQGQRVLIATTNNQALDLLFEKMKKGAPLALPIRLGRKDLWEETAQKIQDWRNLSKERSAAPIEIPYDRVEKAQRALFSCTDHKERKESLQKIAPACVSWGRYLWERLWRKTKISSALDEALCTRSSLSSSLETCGALLFGSTLSSVPNLPLIQGLFDLLIIDEASQCDVFSVLPALWRSKRILVIGDEKQLSPVYGIEKDLDDQLGEKIPPSLRFTRSSFFSRCAHLSKPILLREHHRSRPEIIAVSNQLFYNDRLKAMRKNKTGAVQWFEVNASNQQEAEVRLIASLCEKYKERWSRKEYSVGIVTPFRAQVDRLQKNISHVRIDTAHRFQGEECDVIILSLCVSNRLSTQQWEFIEAPELINVAITRAKERLIIVGDRAVCTQRGGLLASLSSIVGASSNSDYR